MDAIPHSSVTGVRIIAISIDSGPRLRPDIRRQSPLTAPIIQQFSFLSEPGPRQCPASSGTSVSCPCLCVALNFIDLVAGCRQQAPAARSSNSTPALPAPCPADPSNGPPPSPVPFVQFHCPKLSSGNKLIGAPFFVCPQPIHRRMIRPSVYFRPHENQLSQLRVSPLQPTREGKGGAKK